MLIHDATRRGGSLALGLAAGIGAVALLAGPARAQRWESGDVGVTLGFPNGQVHVGGAWGDHDPRPQVVVHEKEIIKEEPAPDERRYDDDDDRDVDHDVIIVKKREPRHVTVIEEEAPACERTEVIRHVYVDPRPVVVTEPSCGRRTVVVERRVEPSRTVIVGPPGWARGHGHGWGRRGGSDVAVDRPGRAYGVHKHWVSVGD